MVQSTTSATAASRRTVHQADSRAGVGTDRHIRPDDSIHWTAAIGALSLRVRYVSTVSTEELLLRLKRTTIFCISR